MATDDRITGDAAAETPASTAGGATPFVFFSPELKQRLDLLRHLVENSEMIPLVKGPAEAGKSTLIRELSQNASEVWRTALFIASPALQPEQFFHSLADAYSVREGESYLVDALLRRFENLSLDGTLPVVVIDDAHLLPEATLAIILELHARAPKEVRFLLFAEPAIENILAPLRSRNLNLQPLQELEMPRLTRDQIRHYVEGLLQARSGAEAPALSAAQLERICKESDGLPGRVTRLVDEIGASRLNGWLKKMPPIQMAGLALAVVLVLMLLIFQDAINALFGGGEDEQPIMETQEPGREIPLQLPPPAQEQVTEQVPAPKAEPEAEALLLPQPVETPTPEPSASAEAPEAVAEEAQEAVVPPPEPEAPDAMAEEAASPVEPTENGEERQVTPDQTAEPAVPAAPALMAEEPAKPAPATEKPPAAEKPAETAKPKPAPKPARQTADSGGVKSEAWLLRQNPAAYTLQLASMQDKAGVPRMVELYKLPGPFAYYRTTRNGAPWYPVLYGLYLNQKDALAARDKLAAGYGLKGAWVRKIGSIQSEIRAK